MKVLGLFTIDSAFAQRTKEIETRGEYQMLIENNMTRDQAKVVGIERARIDAIRREFGEVVV
ncbi:MAG: hypothetical protein ACKOFE_04195, partial [Bacteroidota bacterium]